MVTNADQVLRIKGFTIEISGGGGGKMEDNAWETCTGGGLNIEEAAHTTTPGHKYIDTLTLRGPLTAGRKWLVEALNHTALGKEWKRTVTVKEILRDGSAGRTFVYTNCFITRYVYPALSADGTGKLEEEVSLKPERLELK